MSAYHQPKPQINHAINTTANQPAAGVFICTQRHALGATLHIIHNTVAVVQVGTSPKRCTCTTVTTPPSPLQQQQQQQQQQQRGMSQHLNCATMHTGP
jgi:hypothetical protein